MLFIIYGRRWKMGVSSMIRVRVAGELACFSRPELKTERVSYPWITPSAARAIFEAVLWKPAIRWELRRITLLKPIRYLSFLRNEINTKIAPARAAPGEAYHYVEGDRAQRNTLALRNVDYLVEAEIHMTDKGLADGENTRKFQEMFNRRLERGQHFTQPYLGCREFAADVKPSTGEERAIGDSLDHGLMFYDMRFGKGNKGRNEPFFFHARMKEGVVEVPPRDAVMGGAP